VRTSLFASWVAQALRSLSTQLGYPLLGPFCAPMLQLKVAPPRPWTEVHPMASFNPRTGSRGGCRGPWECELNPCFDLGASPLYRGLSGSDFGLESASGGISESQGETFGPCR